MIWEELNPSLIFTDLKAQDSADVLKQVGGKVIKEGYAKESYVDALLNREAEFPTGLDIDGFGVAIPHTDVNHVNRSGVAIAVLDKPVEFIQMGTDDEITDVRLVFMLSVVEPKKHMDKLQRILEIIQDKDVLEELTGAGNEKEIIEIIRTKESSL